MKLDLFAIVQAIEADDVQQAIHLLLQHFCIPPQSIESKIEILQAESDTRILVWMADGEAYYEWSKSTGFDAGFFNYLTKDKDRGIIESITVWK